MRYFARTMQDCAGVIYHGICIKLILEVRYMKSGQAVMTHNPELKPHWVYAEWRATVDYMVYGLGLRQTWGKQWRSPVFRLPPSYPGYVMS